MRKLPIILLAVFAAGCSRVPMIPGLGPHKIDVQQGNYITQDMVARLKPGMTRSQVRYILGTPLVTDPFHPDRWDYIYHMQKRGVTTEQRRIVVVFEQDKLARIEGDVVPAATGSSADARDAGRVGAVESRSETRSEARPPSGAPQRREAP